MVVVHFLQSLVQETQALSTSKYRSVHEVHRVVSVSQVRQGSSHITHSVPDVAVSVVPSGQVGGSRHLWSEVMTLFPSHAVHWIVFVSHSRHPTHAEQVPGLLSSSVNPDKQVSRHSLL